MPFPPTFTNAWDTTFPPDTQLANLLGQDLRNFRTDVMQRMSLLSGTFANRPTPETVNATWGGAGYGLLYFSTDTAQVFQWSGSAWVDVTLSIFTQKTIFKGAAASHTGTTTEDTIYTVTIAANSLGIHGILRGYLGVVGGNVATPFQLRIKFGGAQIFQFAGSTSLASSYILDFTISNQGLTNVQTSFASFIRCIAGQVTGGINGGAVDTTVNQNLLITIQSGLNADNQNFGPFYIEQI